ncbi:MAG: NTP transferase domain-containing protein [Bilophila sp.]
MREGTVGSALLVGTFRPHPRGPSACKTVSLTRSPRMADSPRLPAVVLAAGFSRRMGRCKLTLPLDGEPLVRRVVRAALEAGLAPSS